MAYSTQRTTSDGTLVSLDLSIDYLDREDINVFFNGLPDDTKWNWVGETDARIEFTPAVPNGVEVLVQRSTALDVVRHIFNLGAAFNNSTMDENFSQVLLLVQEAVEGSGLTDVFNDVDYHGFRITKLGTAFEPTDAVNLGQATAATTAQANAAAASATLAQAWATQLGSPVSGGEYSAKHHAAEAADSAAEAAASAAALPNSVGNNDTFPQVNSSGTGWVYRTIANLKTLLGLGTSAYADIGTGVQAFDAATAKTNVAQTYTAPQKTARITDNDGTFDLNAGGHTYSCTPTGAVTLAFTNIAANDGKSGSILFNNTANYLITKGSNIKCPASLFSTISATGDYWIAYDCDGTSVRLSVSGPNV